MGDWGDEREWGGMTRADTSPSHDDVVGPSFSPLTLVRAASRAVTGLGAERGLGGMTRE